MNEKEFDQNSPAGDTEPQILTNEYGATIDGTVVVEEKDRTVLLTENETIIFEKQPEISIAPKNRPRNVYGGMWGQTEIATAGLAFLAVFSVILLYIFLVAPSNRELTSNRAERDRLELELISSRAKYGDITSTETQVAKLISSVDDFEARYLPVAATGRTSLYQRINGLLAGYGLVNTTGPDFAPLELADQNQANESDEERGRAKFRSIFPGVYVTMTLEGTYQNLRRFIRDIETGDEFIVVSAVELEPSDTQQKDTNAPAQVGEPAGTYPSGMNDPTRSMPAGQTAVPRGKTHGETVSLRLEMAAYFRRVNSVPVDPSVSTQ